MTLTYLAALVLIAAGVLPDRVGKAHAIGSCIEQGLHGAQHLSLLDVALEGAAKGRADPTFDQCLRAG